MKQFKAFVAALAVTALLGLPMLALGANALFRKPAVAAASSPSGLQLASGSQNVNSGSASDQQLQARVAEYQQREQQYRAELNSAQERIQQDEQQLQQYQSLFTELQQLGVISVGRDGEIRIPQR